MSELDNNVHIFCNLDDCEPKHAVSHDFSSYTWRAIPYETEQIKGVMLAADAESNVPDIRIKLGLTGTYDLYICIWSGGGHMEHGISIKLSRDGAWRFIQSDITGHNPKAFEEVWWKTACLEGDDLWIRHPEGGLPKASYLAYIKCIPVDLCKTQPRSSDELLKSTKRLIGMNDMHGLFYTKCPTDIEPILEEIEP